MNKALRYSASLCLAVIIGLPAATPKEHMNSASYALGNFTNCGSNDHLVGDCDRSQNDMYSEWLARWLRLHSELPRSTVDHLYVFISSYTSLVLTTHLANFDSSVHISEESSNAATAVPWAIVSRESHICSASTKCNRSAPLAYQVSLAGVSIHIHP
jgi:hypothetical protein